MSFYFTLKSIVWLWVVTLEIKIPTILFRNILWDLILQQRKALERMNTTKIKLNQTRHKSYLMKWLQIIFAIFSMFCLIQYISGKHYFKWQVDFQSLFSLVLYSLLASTYLLSIYFLFSWANKSYWMTPYKMSYIQLY